MSTGRTANGSAGNALRRLVPKAPENPDVAGRGVWPTPKAPKRTRASRPKVRTGCRTCKIRRLKCDEARPSCERCLKAEFACDGYDSNASPLPAATPSTGPRGKRSSRHASTSSSSTGKRCILRPKPTSSLQILGSSPREKRFSAQEVPYFDFFRHGLVNDLSGYSCFDFWPRVVLSEAVDTDCVRAAVLAIAALARGISGLQLEKGLTGPMSRPSALFPWTSKRIVNENHRVALKYYVQALSTFRKQELVGTEIRSPRTVFIMTMLLLTFELVQGNMEVADHLLTSSIQLLKGSLGEYRQDVCRPRPHQRPRSIMEGDLEDMEHMLPFLSLMGTATPFLKTQPDNLVLWTASSVDDVPDLGRQSPKQLQAGWDRFFTRVWVFAGQAMAPTKPDFPRDFLREQQTYLSHLTKWRAVLDVGLSRATTLGDARARRAIQLMQLHRLMLSIIVRSCLDRTDMAWDACAGDFVVLVERCLAFAAEHRPRYRHAAFTLSMGVLSALGPAIAKCRDHGTRMRALEVARRMPWREGAWDAGAELFGKLGAVLLEERGRDADGFVSAENRWSWLGGEWSAERGILTGQYVRSIPDRCGEPVVTCLELGLDAWPDICRDISCSVNHAVGCEVLDQSLDDRG
jgi:hypothetical protein